MSKTIKPAVNSNNSIKITEQYCSIDKSNELSSPKKRKAAEGKNYKKMNEVGTESPELIIPDIINNNSNNFKLNLLAESASAPNKKNKAKENGELEAEIDKDSEEIIINKNQILETPEKKAVSTGISITPVSNNSLATPGYFSTVNPGIGNWVPSGFGFNQQQLGQNNSNGFDPRQYEYYRMMELMNINSNFNLNNITNLVQNKAQNKSSSKKNSNMNNSTNKDYYIWEKNEEAVLIQARHDFKNFCYFNSTNNHSKNKGWAIVLEKVLAVVEEEERRATLNIGKVKDKYKALYDNYKRRDAQSKTTGTGANRPWEHEEEFVNFYHDKPIINPESIISLGVTGPKETLRNKNSSSMIAGESENEQDDVKLNEAIVFERVLEELSHSSTSDSEVEVLANLSKRDREIKAKRTQAGEKRKPPTKTAQLSKQMENLNKTLADDSVEIKRTSRCIETLVSTLCKWMNKDMASSPVLIQETKPVSAALAAAEDQEY